MSDDTLREKALRSAYEARERGSWWDLTDAQQDAQRQLLGPVIDAVLSEAADEVEHRRDLHRVRADAIWDLYRDHGHGRWRWLNGRAAEGTAIADLLRGQASEAEQ